VTIVEVGPRDGFQSIQPLIPTDAKIALIEKLHGAGVRRMEATAFVSQTAVPQLADAAAVFAGARALDGLDVQVLVPNRRYAERAIEAGARHLAYVLSASERHNLSNVRRSCKESVEDYARIVEALPEGAAMRLNLATVFDCPFVGQIAVEASLALLDVLLPLLPEAEICACDTTGRATPDRVAGLFEAARARFPQVRRWAYHGHDTYGLGVANAIAAMQAEVDVIDASFAGLGGCPFAPGATGNVATEDLVWTLGQMGIDCGIDLDRLIEVSREAAALAGARPGGRVRTAISARLGLATVLDTPETFG